MDDGLEGLEAYVGVLDPKRDDCGDRCVASCNVFGIWI